MVKYFLTILEESELAISFFSSLKFSKLLLDDNALILLLIVVNKNSNGYPSFFFWRILIREIILFSWNFGWERNRILSNYNSPITTLLLCSTG